MKTAKKQITAAQVLRTPHLRKEGSRAIRNEIRRFMFNAGAGTEPRSHHFLESDWNPQGFLGLRIKRLKAAEGIGLALLAIFKSTPGSFYLRDFLAQRARKHQYKGKWMLVHKLLKLQNPILVSDFLLERELQREVFGNFLVAGSIALQRLHLLKPRTGRPKFPKRKRGYDDHGSARAPHEQRNCQVHSGINPETVDLSSLYQKKLALVNWLYG